jgi:membrane protein
MLSVVPLFMLICVVLIRFLHASPETVSSILSLSAGENEFFKSQFFVSVIDSVHRITNFEIVVAAAIVWMARRFFSSVVTGLRKIFGSEVQERPMKRQFLIFSAEIFIVTFFAVLIFLSMSFKTILLFPKFYGVLSPLNFLAKKISKILINLFPFILIFATCVVAYRFASRTKPSFSSSALFSFGTVFSFWVMTNIFHIFINVNRYNFIYGVLSSVIVFLMGTFFFFLIFLFFAQWLFVCQFFDVLLLKELYLLPERKDKKSVSNVKRFLFLSTDFILQKCETNFSFKAGETVYEKNSASDGAFYIVSGKIELQKESGAIFLGTGNFFGEEECILNTSRLEKSVCAEDAVLVKISCGDLKKLVAKDSRVALKILSKTENLL